MDNPGILLLISGISLIITIVIMYYVIESAVSSAMKKQNQNLVNAIRLGNQLKILDLKKNGATVEEIQKQIDFVYNPEKYKATESSSS